MIDACLDLTEGIPMITCLLTRQHHVAGRSIERHQHNGNTVRGLTNVADISTQSLLYEQGAPMTKI